MKPKILIVDDEKMLRDTLAKWFKPTYDCLTAPDAAEAMKIVEANDDLALMISDVKMPGESGISLLRKAKAANPSMATILLTAYGTVEFAVEAMKDGADDFFLKPVTDLKAFETRVARQYATRRWSERLRTSAAAWAESSRSSPASPPRWRTSTASSGRWRRRTRPSSSKGRADPARNSPRRRSTASRSAPAGRSSPSSARRSRGSS